MGSGRTGRAVRSTQPRVVVETASKKGGSTFGLSMMLRAGGRLAVAERVQLAADCLRADRDA